MTAGNEIEVKIRVTDSAAITSRLQGAGLNLAVPRQFEANTLYDTADGKLRASSMILRIREIGEKCVLTWKGPGEPSRYKSRPELETTVGSQKMLHEILTRLGYSPVFRYEKYRTEYSDPASGAGTVTRDETPIGEFLELEGPGGWIDEMAARLGFSERDYILDSYGKLYLADCERRGVQRGDMVFASGHV